MSNVLSNIIITNKSTELSNYNIIPTNQFYDLWLVFID